MIEFAALVAEKWNIDKQLAVKVCTCFEKGDTIFYLSDYSPDVSAQLDLAALGDIYEFLRRIEELAPKKKRIIGMLHKANALTEDIERRIQFCTSGTELDDIAIQARPSQRSRAGAALARGLGPLADVIAKQEVTDSTVEQLAQRYVNPDSGLQSVEDVLAGVKDILVERFACDETVRAMVREFGHDNGFVEVAARDRKDREFIAYRGKMVPVAEITPEEFIRLFDAEQKKNIRIKFGVQLFRISELLRHHFIVNPDSSVFDFLCETIDECWTRSLQHIVESDIRETMQRRAEDWALARIAGELSVRWAAEGEGTTLAAAQTEGKVLVMVAFNDEGRLLGAGREDRAKAESQAVQRLQQFVGRYRPRRIVVLGNAQAANAEAMVRKAAGETTGEIAIAIRGADAAIEKLAQSPWMEKECAYLDADMRMAYAAGLAVVLPVPIITRIGVEHFELHALQKHVSAGRLTEILNRRMMETALQQGISILDIADSALAGLSCVPPDMCSRIRSQAAREHYRAKNDLLKIEGMTEVIFRNISGYVYFPNGATALDRSLVHPDHFSWVEEMASRLRTTTESLINDPEQIRSLGFDDFAEKIFVEKKLLNQLRAGRPYLSAPPSRSRGRMHFDEIAEGAVLSGRVTNITPFGVFVDINAVCDGLVHISQLADGYVETPDQVVSLGDQISVRVIKVDPQKRRISLTMKGMGEKGPRIRPTKDQLTTLADHFKNR